MRHDDFDVESKMLLLPYIEEDLRLYGHNLLLENYTISEDEFALSLEKKAEDLDLYVIVGLQLRDGQLQDDVYHNLQQLSRKMSDEEADPINDQLNFRLKHIVRENFLSKIAKDLWTSLRRDFLLTPNGNGERFVAENEMDVRFCPAKNTWHVWDGMRWREDSTRARVQIRKKALETVRRIKAQADAKKDSELLNYWKSCDKPAALNSILDAAILDSRIQITPEEFDTQKSMLNCKNGYVDLKVPHTEVLPHRRLHYQTRMVPFAYDPQEICPVWKNFLSVATQGDEDLQRFLQRIVGYALTGEVAEKCLFSFLGDTNTGKTTFVEAINELMGRDYAAVADFATFALGRKTPGIRNDLARLQKKRYVAASETGKEEKFDDVVLKRFTGADTIIARFLFREFDEFRPEAKVFLAANHGPLLDPNDDAAWNRFVVIPFDVQIPPERQDRQIKEKFRAELPGILAWAVNGARAYYRYNFIEGRPLDLPARVRSAGEAYRTYCYGKVAKIDPSGLVAMFVEERCEVISGAEERPESLYRDFEDWYKENYEFKPGEDFPITQNMFGRKITELLKISSKTVTREGESIRVYQGLRIKGSHSQKA